MNSEPIQALLVEDNPGDARLLREMLVGVTSPRFELTHVERLGRALQCLEGTRFDVILLDLLLPDAQGFTTFSTVQTKRPRLPIIVLTGMDDEAMAMQTVRRGAQDYLVKGQFDRDLLVRAVRYGIERKLIEEELRKHREHLAEMVEERTADLRRANDELQREVAERKRAEERTRASLREKEVLLQELHDRVRNNLQVIASLLDMQTLYSQHDQARHALQESQNRVRAMAFAQEQLYRSPDLAEIDVAAYVEGIAGYLSGAFGNPAEAITVGIHTDGLFLDLETAVSCGLIISELVSNALKHAFPSGWPAERPRIWVELRPIDGRRFVLVVGDNGVGLAAGADPQEPQTLGLRVVKMFTQQLGGRVEVGQESGTVFSIEFPAPKRSWDRAGADRDRVEMD